MKINDADGEMVAIYGVMLTRSSVGNDFISVRIAMHSNEETGHVILGRLYALVAPCLCPHAAGSCCRNKKFNKKLSYRRENRASDTHFLLVRLLSMTAVTETDAR